jgi:phosphatidate cytidylyltransferase
MPHNPFAHPLFVPAAWRIAALLTAGLVAVALVERKPPGELLRSTLFVRVRTWAVIAPLFLLALFSGGVVLLGLAAFIALQGVGEYARVTRLQRPYALLLAAGALAGLLVAALAHRFLLFLPLGFFVLVNLVPIVSGRIQEASRQLGLAVFGFLYIALPMAYLVYVQSVERWGLSFLLLVGLAVALSDVAAFAVGSALKGPKLAPHVSPGKTWAGVAGNLLGAAVGVAVLLVAIPPEWTPAGTAALVALVAAGGVLGDLVESVVKRDGAVKDTGTLLPGFGGVLDRVDSLLLALPLAYHGLLVANHFFARG